MASRGDWRERRRGGAGTVLGGVLIAFGLLFLLGQTTGLSPWHYLWPLFVITPGLLFFAGMLSGGRGTSGMAIPGSIVTTIGVILLYQNTTGHWTSAAYTWALIVASVGVGLAIHGVRSGASGAILPGLIIAGVGLGLFLAFGFFFEVLLNISGFWNIGRLVWPLLLIGAGVAIVGWRWVVSAFR